MNDERIYELAKAAGLMREWVNAAGEPMQVSPDAMRDVLQALGLQCDSDGDYREACHRLEVLKAGDVLSPLVTGTVDTPVRLPGVRELAGKSYRVACESGGEVTGRLPDEIGDGIEMPAIDRPGFHRLYVGEHEITLAIAPERCFGIADALHLAGNRDEQERMRLWGLGVQMYSLRRDGDGGIGDYTSLARFAESAAAQGASAVAISPVHGMFNADPGRFSPYGPSSRLFLNVWHIDPASVLGQQEYAAALSAMGGDAANKLAAFEQNELIDWPGAMSLRLSLLRRLYDRFNVLGDEGEFEAFRIEKGAALRDHARFEALHAWRLAEGQNGDWRSWPEGLRNPHGAEVERFAREHANEVRFHEFLQWQAARGLSGAQQAARKAGMPIGLIADLAVGADNGGSQAWSRQKEIINGLSVGAPPDIMNPRGQSWGLGAFSPHAMKAEGFGAYIEMLRSTFKYGGGARIDHVLGLSRLWLVPQGASSEYGAYLKYPMHDLLRLIALESWRHRAIVIGENLGTVPPGFDDILARYGVLGIQVLLFQKRDSRFLQPSEWSRDSIATTTTHDLPTMAGWWRGRDIDWRVKLDLLAQGQTEEEARQDRARERSALWQALREDGKVQGDEAGPGTAPVDAAIEFVAESPAPLAMLPIEDILGLVEQPNLPGTVESHPNWRRRMPYPVNSLLQTPEAAKRVAILNRTRSRCVQGEKS